jgi:hypothetical protein
MLLPHELSPMSVPFAKRTSQVIYSRKQARPGILDGGASGGARCEAPERCTGIHRVMFDDGWPTFRTAMSCGRVQRSFILSDRPDSQTR